MSSSIPFLHLRLPTPNTSEICLEEWFSTYDTLQGYGASTPTVITCIGRAKTENVIMRRHPRLGSVVFEYRPSLQSIRSMQYWNPHLPSRKHLINAERCYAVQFEYGLCWNVLSIFSDLVVVVVSGIGGRERAISILCYWAVEPNPNNIPPRRLLVVSDDTFNKDCFIFDLATALLRGHSGPSRMAQAQNLLRAKFILTFCSEKSDLNSIVAHEAKCAAQIRTKEGTTTPGNQLGYLLRKAVEQYVNYPDIHFCMISGIRNRTSTPIPSEAISEFWLSYGGPSLIRARLLASAFWLDATRSNVTST